MSTAKKMLSDMEKLGLKLPLEGSGREGRILNSDLEKVLADHHASQRNLLSAPSWGWQARLSLREVMLSYRFDKLTPEKQTAIMEDDSWFAEEKYDGCRMIVTYDPEDGFGFYGRNRSRANYLPINYTDTVLVAGKPGKEYAGILGDEYLVFDSEIVTEGYVETQAGTFTGSKLNAAATVLSLNPSDSFIVQRTTAPLQCILFDLVPLTSKLHLVTSTDAAYIHRRRVLEGIYYRLQREFGKEFFALGSITNKSKHSILEGYLAEGKEGVILKHQSGLYVPGINGFRDAASNLKVKRTISGTLGDEIDAYIIGSTRGEEWDKEGLIAGVKLAVKVRTPEGKVFEHWIATVSGIPDAERILLSCIDERGKPVLKPSFLGTVLAIDGQDISSRNNRVAHAKVDWNKGFRTDKTADSCIVEEGFIFGAMF